MGAKRGERKRENGCGRSGIIGSGIPSGWSILTVLSTIERYWRRCEMRYGGAQCKMGFNARFLSISWDDLALRQFVVLALVAIFFLHWTPQNSLSTHLFRPADNWKPQAGGHATGPCTRSESGWKDLLVSLPSGLLLPQLIKRLEKAIKKRTVWHTVITFA